MKQYCRKVVASAAAMFALALPVSSLAAVKGQWDFNSSNLVATVGTDLAYWGDTESATTFSKVKIGGSDAIVMNFPACSSAQGYEMTHGVEPNGGGAYVNQYTLIMDIMFPTASTGKWRGLLQTGTANSNDGDLFVNAANGIGISGAYHGTILPDTWHRVAFVVDMTAEAPTNKLTKYIDGVQVGGQSDGFNLDGRWSLDPTALLFTDEDGETAEGSINSLQIHDVALSARDIFALGKATAAGIPKDIPALNNLIVTLSATNQNLLAEMAAVAFTATAVGDGTITYQWYRNDVLAAGQTGAQLRFSSVKTTDAGSYKVVVNNGLQTVTSAPPAVLTVSASAPASVTGQWDFKQGDLRATYGQPMQYFDAEVQAGVSFGTTTSFGISDIGGQSAPVMFCNAPGGTPWGGLIVPHGVGANGGGTNANQYTIIMDVLYPSYTAGYRALWQTDVANTNDADAFLNGDSGLGISGQYQGLFTPDEWHRVVLAFDLTRREFGKYIDGTNVLSGPVGAAPLGDYAAQYLGGGDVDLRWSLGPTALLFADEDGEVQPVFVSSVQARNGRMTDAAVAALGGPSASKIPGLIKSSRTGANVVIEWTGSVLESATSISGPWTTVTGAGHPYTVTAPKDTRYYRVVR